MPSGHAHSSPRPAANKAMQEVQVVEYHPVYQPPHAVSIRDTRIGGFYPSRDAAAIAQLGIRQLLFALTYQRSTFEFLEPVMEEARAYWAEQAKRGRR